MALYLGKKRLFSKTGARFASKNNAHATAKSVFSLDSAYKIVKSGKVWKVRLVPNLRR